MSGHEDLKSASRTSISVKLPSAQHRSHSRGTISPDSHLSSELKGSDFNASKSPLVLPSHTLVGQVPLDPKQQLIRSAVAVIERTWIAYRDRQMFKLLKHSVCAAETSLSYEILRKLCPKEAEFLKDNKCHKIRVRFRFGGEEFPPLIFFKLYTQTENGKSVKYVSGRKMIRPATEAAQDSLRLMGNRNFYDQLLQDALRQHHCPIADEVDVTTLKDYMQYLSNLDETPAYLGGKENYWRKLSLDDLPRHTIFYDVVDLAYNHRMTPRLREEIPLLVLRPLTQEIQVKHIQAISMLRPPSTPLVPAPTPTKYKATGTSQLSSRRSRQARMRAMKMKKLYSGDKMGQIMDEDITDVDYYNQYKMMGDKESGEETDEMFETEAKKLFEWTQGLSFNDDILTLTATPLSPAH